MSDGPQNIKTPGPMMLRKNSSGEHPIMQAVQQARENLAKGPLTDLKALNRRIDRIKIRTGPPTEDEIKKANSAKDEDEEPIPDTEPEGGKAP